MEYTHDEWVEARAWAQRIVDDAETYPEYEFKKPLVLAARLVMDLPEPAPRTFAGMTGEERRQCRGMWVKAQDEVGVLLTSDVTLGTVFVPRVNNWFTPLLEEIEILFDRPRAWNTDGTPAEPGQSRERDTEEV